MCTFYSDQYNNIWMENYIGTTTYKTAVVRDKFLQFLDSFIISTKQRKNDNIKANYNNNNNKNHPSNSNNNYSDSFTLKITKWYTTLTLMMHSLDTNVEFKTLNFEYIYIFNLKMCSFC